MWYNNISLTLRENYHKNKPIQNSLSGNLTCANNFRTCNDLIIRIIMIIIIIIIGIVITVSIYYFNPTKFGRWAKM